MELQSIALPTELPFHIAGAGRTYDLRVMVRRATQLLHPRVNYKGGCGIRTYARFFTRLTVFKTVPSRILQLP